MSPSITDHNIATRLWIVSFAIGSTVPLMCNCSAAKPERRALVESKQDNDERRKSQMLQRARMEERKLYLLLAERTRAGLPTSGQQGFDYCNLNPIIARQPSDPSGEKQMQLYEEALKAIEATNKSIQESAARRYEKLADDVLVSGPFGDFGGPTSLDITKSLVMGTDPFASKASRIDKYAENSVVLEIRPLPRRQDPPREIRVRTPQGDTVILDRVYFNTYRVR